MSEAGRIRVSQHIGNFGDSVFVLTKQFFCACTFEFRQKTADSGALSSKPPRKLLLRHVEYLGGGLIVDRSGANMRPESLADAVCD